MELKVMDLISKEMRSNRGLALVTVIEACGSSPGKKGDMMCVLEDGCIEGTVGGGNLEYQLIQEAKKAIVEKKDKEISYSLGPDGDLKMECGGKIRAFIKVFKGREKLVIVGGGHLGLELYKLGKFLDMHISVFDDREEFANRERFLEVDEVYSGDISKNLINYHFDENSYVVIVTRGHVQDLEALKVLIDKKTKYLGMIGSSRKVAQNFKLLMESGVDKEKLEKVYAPIGLDISNGDPKEIALGIVAEILKVKNNRSGKNMKEIKSVGI